MRNIFIHLGFIFIFFGISLAFVDHASASIKNYYDDIEESKKIIKKVDYYYDEFKNDAIDVKNSIVDVSKLMNVYLDDFKKANVKINEKISLVKEKLDKINITSNELINNCRYDLNNKNMNNKCQNFKTNYLNMYSSYESMIEHYNKLVESYNNYAKKKGKGNIELLSGEIEESKRIISVIK